VECDVCKVRSAVGQCEESNVLVCEECSTTCSQCGKRIASSKGHISKSGNVYGGSCHEERAARRAARHHRREAVEEPGPGGGLIPVGTGGPPDDEVLEEEAVLSQWRTAAPWKWSLGFGILGIVLMIVFIAFPSIRGIRLSANFYFPFAVLMLIIPIFALVWAYIGYRNRQFTDDANRGIYGAALAVVTIVLAFWASQSPPPPEELLAIEGTRDEAGDVQQWRQEFLQDRR